MPMRTRRHYSQIIIRTFRVNITATHSRHNFDLVTLLILYDVSNHALIRGRTILHHYVSSCDGASPRNHRLVKGTWSQRFQHYTNHSYNVLSISTSTGNLQRPRHPYSSCTKNTTTASYNCNSLFRGAPPPVTVLLSPLGAYFLLPEYECDHEKEVLIARRPTQFSRTQFSRSFTFAHTCAPQPSVT